MLTLLACGPQTEKQFDAQEERVKASQQELESVRRDLQSQLEASQAAFESLKDKGRDATQREQTLRTDLAKLQVSDVHAEG